jgi:hypothetical protein
VKKVSVKKLIIFLLLSFLLVSSVSAYSRKTFILNNYAVGENVSNYNFVNITLNNQTISNWSEVGGVSVWNVSGDNVFYNKGLVGINKYDPDTTLHVVSKVSGVPIVKKVLFNAKDNTSLDATFETPWISLLESFGYDVSVVSDSDLVAYLGANINNYFILFVRPTGDGYAAHPLGTTLNDFDLVVVGLDRHVGRVSLGMSGGSLAKTYQVAQVKDVSLSWMGDYVVDETFNSYTSSGSHHAIRSLSSGTTSIINENGQTNSLIAVKDNLAFDRVFIGAHRVNSMTDEMKNIIRDMTDYYYDLYGGDNIYYDALKVEGDSVFEGSVLVNDYYLPFSDGSSNQYLRTNGAGVLGWNSIDLSGYVPFTGATSNLDFNGKSMSDIWSVYSYISNSEKFIGNYGFFGDYNESAVIPYPSWATANQIPGAGTFNYGPWIFGFEVCSFKDIMGQRIRSDVCFNIWFNDQNWLPDPYDILLAWDCLNIDDVDGYFVTIILDDVNGYYGDYHFEFNNTICNFDYQGGATLGPPYYDNVYYENANIVLNGIEGSGHFTDVVIADDFITTSKVTDIRVSSLKHLDNIDRWLRDDKVQHREHYAYVNQSITDYSRPVIDRNGKVTYPFTIEIDGLSMETRVAELEGMIYELTQELCKQNNRYDFCK